MSDVDRLLLLHTDRSDPVAATILDHAGRFGREVVALTLETLVRDVRVDAHWRWGRHRIDPARTAVVNRLAIPRPGEPSPFDSAFAERQTWAWLRDALARFAYASSLPTPTSIAGCFGSLLDQWIDLPALAGPLDVPAFRAPGDREPLDGDMYATDPWRLYSLGTRLDGGASAAASVAALRYRRPHGRLVHVAQVGGMLLPINAPPDLTRVHEERIIAFARRLERRSPIRILEHAFFIDPAGPVLFSTCPVPVIAGGRSEYADLLVHGLADDIERRTRVAA